jgi:hypothetical protein
VVSQAIDMHTLKPDPCQSDRLRGDTMKWEQGRRLNPLFKVMSLVFYRMNYPA